MMKWLGIETLNTTPELHEGNNKGMVGVVYLELILELIPASVEKGFGLVGRKLNTNLAFMGGIHHFF